MILILACEKSMKRSCVQFCFDAEQQSCYVAAGLLLQPYMKILYHSHLWYRRFLHPVRFSIACFSVSLQEWILPLYFQVHTGCFFFLPPIFTVLIYSIIGFRDDVTHISSGECFPGKSTDMHSIEKYSLINTVSHLLNRLFLVPCSDDPVVPVENSVLYYQACLKQNVSVEIHI